MKKGLFILCLLLLSVVGLVRYHTMQLEQIEQAKIEAQAKQDAKDLAPFSKDVSTLPIASGVADSANVISLNEALVPPNVELDIVTDLPTAQLYIGFEGQIVKQYNKDFFLRSIYYASAMNFSRIHDLQAVHFYFDDQIITVSRVAFADALGADVSIDSLVDVVVWETQIVGKLLDKEYLKQFINEVTTVEKGGLAPLEEIQIMPELLLYLEMKLGVEETNLAQLPFEVVKPMLVEMDRVVQLYPELDGYITAIDVTDQIDAERFMELQPAVDFDSASIRLSSSWYSDMDDLEENWRLGIATDFYPDGTESDTIVVHELTHGLESYIIGARYEELTTEERIGIWESSTVSKEIISSAYAKVSPQLASGTTEEKAVADISGYAATGGPSEALAEAAHDVYDNGDSAEAMSIAMVEELNKVLTSVSGTQHSLVFE